MGQDVTVTQIESGHQSSHIFSLNRSLTGMEIITYENPEMTVDPNNVAQVLAKRLLEIGIESVSIYSNVITLNCEPEVYSKIKNEVKQTLENLFRFYGDNAGWAPRA